ncbi:MAG: radical SAM protein [Pseudobutyrivibrio ruminis]|jgi:MoaA/NifB/PqqE/SkfB family radical SAM enzyme|uniref:radical SAM protein n=1 Tax=Pseudobutyrivibrio ruminis TaxID=46206 RepID=UPI0026EFD350|nr:radical SAM protein [Pseudobutyrivibrio ruminis]MBE5913078.1 radical SAM protein [Pseudobutyrivibrio ruminis]
MSELINRNIEETNTEVWHYSGLVSPFNQSKILVHSDKLKELKHKHIVTPICCEIDLADGFCNNKCVHCFFGTNEKQNPVFMNVDRLKRLLIELKVLGVKSIEFSGGGEPTTHDDIREIVKYAYELGFDIGIVTNGLLLNRLSGMYHMFKFIRVSVDAATPELYKKIHGVDCFDKVINNIRMVVESGNNKNIGIGYLVTGENNEDIVLAAKYFGELGCRFVQYRPASVLYDVDKDIWKDSHDKVLEAEKYASDNFQVFDAGIKWMHIEGKRYYKKCTTSCLVAVIKANGDVPMCVLKRNDRETILGNIYESNFENIFFSDLHSNLIKSNNLNNCRKPCKHDSYNIMQEAIDYDYIHLNFV